jgi:hypothetical protein
MGREIKDQTHVPAQAGIEMEKYKSKGKNGVLQANIAVLLCFLELEKLNVPRKLLTMR